MHSAQSNTQKNQFCAKYWCFKIIFYFLWNYEELSFWIHIIDQSSFLLRFDLKEAISCLSLEVFKAGAAWLYSPASLQAAPAAMAWGSKKPGYRITINANTLLATILIGLAVGEKFVPKHLWHCVDFVFFLALQLMQYILQSEQLFSIFMVIGQTTRKLIF